MQDRFKVRCYVTENEGYPDKIGYVNTEDFYIHPEGEVCFFNADYDYAECVVEQCTSLKDKNGKLIYEGDIIEDDNTKSDRGVVFFDKYSARFMVKMYKYNQKVLIKKNIRVVGNIHEENE